MNHSHIYRTMIAGSIPSFKMDIDAAIVKIAGDILQDYRLHVLQARHGDHVFFFAVASRWISHAQSFGTALAAALPGHPQHRGDGVYALQAGEETFAAVKQGADLFLLQGDASTVEAAAKQHGLSIHATSPQTEAWPLTSVFSQQRRQIERVTGKITAAAAWLLGTCATAYLLLCAGETYLNWHQKPDLHSPATADLVRQFQYTSPLFEQLAHFQQISATVVRAGGWIEGYTWKPGQDESFEIVMPGWISQDYIEALGKGTIADYNIPDNLVIAHKGTLKKGEQP